MRYDLQSNILNFMDLGTYSKRSKHLKYKKPLPTTPVFSITDVGPRHDPNTELGATGLLYRTVAAPNYNNCYFSLRPLRSGR